MRGLLGNLVHVAVLFQSFPGMDILTLSETHLEEKNELVEASSCIPGYSFVSRPRKSGKGGGVAAYIKDGIIWNRRQDLEIDSIETIWIEIRPNTRRLSSWELCIVLLLVLSTSARSLPSS